MLGLRYNYYVNSNRKHGFMISPEKLSGWLVIASDFTITLSEMQSLVDNNVVVLSTEHHECQPEFIDVHGNGNEAEGIVLNNQYPFEPEEDRYLSGAGVFYELACALYPEFKTVERTALVGVTLLSDVRDIENKKARHYLHKTYTINPEKGYIKYLIDCALDSDFGFGVPKFDRNFIDYSLSPKINALLRFDKTIEAIQFVLGNGLGFPNAQKAQRELVEKMGAVAEVLTMPHLHILAVNASCFSDMSVDITGFVGLLCSQHKDRNKGVSTLGFVFSNGKITRASFRGKYDDVKYRERFRSLGLDAQGHKNSFGIVDFKPVEDTWSGLDILIEELERGHKSSITVIETNNLASLILQRGMSIAESNCYVRDMYRTYIKYTGSFKLVKETYKMVEFTPEDYINGTVADSTSGGMKYRYVRDSDGNKVPKYIEYLVGGKKVKSFGVHLEDGMILPVLEKGYLQLYVRSPLV